MTYVKWKMENGNTSKYPPDCLIGSPGDADRRQAHGQPRVRIAQHFRLPKQSVRKDTVKPLQVLRQRFNVRPLVGEAEPFEQQPSNRRDGEKQAVGVSPAQNLEARASPSPAIHRGRTSARFRAPGRDRSSSIHMPRRARTRSRPASTRETSRASPARQRRGRESGPARSEL